MFDIEVLQVDGDGDGVSDYKDDFPTNNAYSYYETSGEQGSGTYIEQYLDADEAVVLKYISEYDSDGELESYVQVEVTESGVTISIYEDGDGVLEKIIKNMKQHWVVGGSVFR